jgi:hypothetical protein
MDSDWASRRLEERLAKLRSPEVRHTKQETAMRKKHETAPKPQKPKLPGVPSDPKK